MDLGAGESFENGKLLRSCVTEVNLASEDLVSPRSDPAGKQVAGRGCRDVMSHDEDILILNVDGEAPEEEMKCELEDEPYRIQKRVRTISDPGQHSKKEREEHEATHAQYRSWCTACVRGRGTAMKHHRSIGAGSAKGKMHTFVNQQRNQDQGDQHVHGPEQRCQLIPCQNSSGLYEWVRLRSRHTRKRW